MFCIILFFVANVRYFGISKCIYCSRCSWSTVIKNTWICRCNEENGVDYDEFLWTESG